MNTAQKIGTLYTVSAPSGAGKTSLVKALVESTENMTVSVSHTTRAMRPGEKDGVNYHFVEESQFLAMAENEDFLEHAKVFTNFYGTSRSYVTEALNQGLDVILEIDWQGAKQVREKLPETISIFILPPSRKALHERLTGRGQDDNGTIQRRMAEAKGEISHYHEANFLIINDKFEHALKEFRSITDSQRLTLEKQRLRHQNLVTELLS